MKNKLSFRIKMLITFIFAAIAIAIISISIYAAVSQTAARGEIEVTSTQFTATDAYTTSESDFTWTYTEAGQKKDITITTNNQASLYLRRAYKIECENDNALRKAILVYYNGKYFDTLSRIVTDGIEIFDPLVFIPAGTSGVDTISFELHQGADGSVFDDKSISIRITTFTENADYSDYMFVETENDFALALDDINSGLVGAGKIVLCKALALTKSYTIKEPATIILNNKTITGALTINDDETTNPNALLYVEGEGTFGATVTLGANYDKDGADSLAINYVKEQIGEGINSGATKNIVGNYGFYSLTITANGGSYTKPTLTAETTEYTKINTIVIGENTFEYKVYGSKEALTTELSHLPASGSTIIDTDLFLPTYIPAKNATITWTSSNPSVINDKGEITTTFADDVAVKLYATIRVNDTEYTEVFPFKVSVHNNQINFYKLVQELSPLLITEVNTGSNDAKALYHLPIVSSSSDYDYRKEFTYVTSPDAENTYSWSGFRDIGLVNLTYTLNESYTDEFDYITLSGNTVKLNKTTLSNYAKLTISGDFGNSEIYNCTLNVSIAVGSDTQLLEEAFSNVNNAFSEIDILANILETRISNGILNEKGDFTLPSKYEDNFTFTYDTLTSAQNILSAPVKINDNTAEEAYKITVNPDYFNDYETTLAIIATVTFNNGTNTITRNRTFYVNAPAAMHVSDFGTLSIFNSVKYQVINQLPDEEKANATGFSLSGATLTNSSYGYILLRDIVGDVSYAANYSKNNGAYLTTVKNDKTLAATYKANGCTTLTLRTSGTNNSATTDTLAYDFMKLVQWALTQDATNAVNKRPTAATVLSAAGQTVLGDLKNTKSNGKSYLSDQEVSVLKAFYQSCTGATDVQWNTLYAEVFERAPGYVYDDATLITTVLKCLSNEVSTWYEDTDSRQFGVIYAKYLEVINRYAITTSEDEIPYTPAKEVCNSKCYFLLEDSAGGNASILLNSGKYYNRYDTAGDWSVNSTTDVHSFAYQTYNSDKTKYITTNELEVLKGLWLKALDSRTREHGTWGNYDSASTNNILTSFNSDSKALLDAAVQSYKVYSSYTESDFVTYGQAIVNGFDACLTVPTYFTDDGVGKLINSFYNNYNKSSVKYELTTYGSASTKSFVSIVDSEIPYVTNLDNIESALTYFLSLTSLTIKGTDNLSIFHGENSLAKAFARITINNQSLTSLSMNYVATDAITFDITNIGKLTNLTYVDIKHNAGLTDVTPLINSNRANYTYVNICDIGEVFAYNEFTIDNVASSTCTVHYTNGSGADTSTTTGNPSVLSDLSGIDDFVSPYLYLTNVIYKDDGTSQNVVWRIESGNDIEATEVLAGNVYEKINSVNEMNMFVSPYYYCNVDFTYGGKDYKAGNVYELYIDNNSLVTVQVNVLPDGTVFPIELADTIPYYTLTQLENITDDKYETVNDQTIDNQEGNKTSTAYKAGTIFLQDSSVPTDETQYTLYFRYQVFYFNASEYGNNTSRTFYLRSSGDEIVTTRDSIDSTCYFVLLSEYEAKFLKEVIDNGYTIPSATLSNFNITPSGSIIYLGMSSISSGVSQKYIYNVRAVGFLSNYGFTNVLGSKFDIAISNSKYLIYNNSNARYLNQNKVCNSSSKTALISPVYKTDNNKSETLTNKDSSNANYLNSFWLLDGSDEYQGDDMSAKINTPQVSIATGVSGTYTATFKVYTFRNARSNSNGYAYDTGSYLLVSTSGETYANSNYFVLLDDEQKEILDNWYKNPSGDISVGKEIGNNKVYYIFNPYTRRYVKGGTDNSDGKMYYTVKDAGSAQRYKFNYTSATDGQGSGTGYSIKAAKASGNIYNNKSWNAYGGINLGALFIATYDVDSGSLWIAEEVTGQSINRTEIEYESPVTPYNAYQLVYEVNKINSKVINKDITKLIDVDKYYYLNSDITIDGYTYKKGNVIRLQYNAFFGKNYEANLEYYETSFFYVDDVSKTNSNISLIQDSDRNYIEADNYSAISYLYYYNMNNSYSLDLSKISIDISNLSSNSNTTENITDSNSGNSFLTITNNTGITGRVENGAFVAIDSKGDNIQVTFNGTGTIEFQASSTGGSNYSALGLKNSSNTYITASSVTNATLIAAGVKGGTSTSLKDYDSTTEYGAYSIFGTTKATITYTIATPGTYTISCPYVTNGRATRIYSITMSDTSANVSNYKGNVSFVKNTDSLISNYDKAMVYTTHLGNVRVEFGDTIVTVTSDESEATSGWHIRKNTITTNFSHSKLISADSFATGGNVDVYVKAYNTIFTGTDVTESYKYSFDGASGAERIYYRDSTGISNYESINYIIKHGYYLTKDANNLLKWNETGTTVTNLSYGATMDGYLAAANENFKTTNYGYYYGRYYGYGGPTETTKEGHRYVTMTIYRLMPNAANSAFEWRAIQKYTKETSNAYIKKTASGDTTDGQIFYSTSSSFGDFYAGDKFYKTVKDEFTDTLNITQYNYVNFMSIGTNYSVVQSEMQRTTDQGSYLGYAGTFEIELSAVIRTWNVDHYDEKVKTYKIKFVGKIIATGHQ